jgi:hypothetical protein
MTRELEQELIKKYPILFKDVNMSPRETLMCFGIEFQDGWYKIFDELCEYITLVCKQERLVKLKQEFKTEANKGYMFVKVPDITFVQVKEKYGTMRVYIRGVINNDWDAIEERIDPTVDIDSIFASHYERIERAIEYVQFLSGKVCEVCGSPGKVYTQGWYMCRCKPCIILDYGYDPDEEEDNEEVT